MPATTPAPCVLSIAEHTGWAHVVSVAARERVPHVVARRRVTVLDAGLPNQPYEHDTRAMTEDDANALIARVRRSAATRTVEALRHVISDLGPGYAVVALTIRKPPFPKLPASVTGAWASHPLLYSADGMIFQHAFCRAARSLGLELHEYPRREAVANAAARLHVSPEEIEAFVTVGGRPPGPPWTQEHRSAFAAGIAVLADYLPRPLIVRAT